MAVSAERLTAIIRRTLLAVVVTPFLAAIGLTLFDSYRRRGKKPKPFPTTPPRTVEVGHGEVTTYTFGSDLYDDMLAAIDERRAAGALRDLHLEGRRGRPAVQGRAGRGGRPRRGGLLHLRRLREPRGLAGVQAVPGQHEGAASTRCTPPGWRFFDLRRYGRDHRKILVVDDAVGFVGGYNIGTAYATEWRDTHVGITGPGVWDLKRAFADFWNLNRRRRFGPSERPLLLETASTWEPQMRFHRNVPRLMVFPIRGDVPGGDRPRQQEHLDDAAPTSSPTRTSSTR